MRNIKQDIKSKVYEWLDAWYKRLISYDEQGEEHLPDLWERYDAISGDFDMLAREIKRANKEFIKGKVLGQSQSILNYYGYTKSEAKELIEAYVAYFQFTDLSNENVDFLLNIQKDYEYLLFYLIDVMSSSQITFAVKEWLEKKIIFPSEVELSDEEYDEGFDD